MPKYVLFVGSFMFAVSLAVLSGGSEAHAACNANALTRTVYGQSGVQVTALQECLIGAGYSIPAGATGYYGTQTRTAVKQFYTAKLSMPDWDGNSVGPQGRTKLAGVAQTVKQQLPVPTTPVVTATHQCAGELLSSAVYGQSNSMVIQLQQCLIDADYSIPAGPTGYYGGQTQAAVQSFYRDHLGMSDWHGRSVGPLGRTTLGALVQPKTQTSSSVPPDYKRANTAVELQKYLAEREISFRNGVGVDVAFGAPMAMEAADNGQGVSLSKAVEPSRVSETTVQVAGIDEPDIVKTDGESIFISRQRGWYGRGIIDEPVVMTDATVNEGIAKPVQDSIIGTMIVNAFPLDEIGIASESIEERGEMLLDKDENMLVIFAYPDVVGYDISNPEKPVKEWELALGDNTTMVTARQKGDTMYLVTRTWMHRDRPCPFELVVMEGTRNITVPCHDIWVPGRIELVSHAYTVLELDPVTGIVNTELSIAAQGDSTVVSVFPDNLYFTTHSTASRYMALADMYIDVFEPYLSSVAIARARTIQNYDISEEGKLEEMALLFETELASMSADERLRIENETENKLQDELQKRVREMDRTRIVRVPLDTFEIAATGEIPGTLLNQFSLDEYDNHVRVAVTVDDGWGGAESVNDVYILDLDLEEVGSVKDLGITERIYSVRFMGDTGYMVTFRQVDPFYVLDLRTPSAPKVTGELKIPGYSAYLEPLGDDLVLGVGREGGGVKLSVFDVSDPAKPIEKSKYQLKESWTEVESNHHAFLRDAKHEVFFIPGSQGGYVFSYEKGSLSFEATVAGWSVKRAVYIDDHLYVIGEDKIVVLDENTWEKVEELSLR